MTGQPTDSGELRARMVRRLAANSYLSQWKSLLTPWLAALAAVPRHRYIPDLVWINNDGNGPTLLPLHHNDDPNRWLELAYGDDAVITQIDDGRPAGPDLGGTMPTSSASSPIIVAVMLAAVDARPGHQVLEIGTGTGHNAALLAYRLGAEQVTSIEIDSEVAAQARKALSGTGFGEVCVVTGDGARGHPPNAPYDRVLATAAAHHIPFAWITQTRPGGRVVLPWANSYTGALVALTVDDHGSAHGGIVAESSFMWLRDQRERRGPVASVIGDDERRARVSTTDLHPYWVTGDHGAQFAIGQRVPRCQWRYWPYEDKKRVGVLWLLDPDSRSWAKLTHTEPDASDEEFPVRQYGPRRLWDEVEAAHSWWAQRDKPGVDRWRFTVSSKGQRIELVDS